MSWLRRLLHRCRPPQEPNSTFYRCPKCGATWVWEARSYDVTDMWTYGYTEHETAWWRYDGTRN